MAITKSKKKPHLSVVAESHKQLKRWERAAGKKKWTLSLWVRTMLDAGADAEGVR